MSIENIIIPQASTIALNPVNEWIERKERATTCSLSVIIECDENASRDEVASLWELGRWIEGPNGRTGTDAGAMIVSYQDAIRTEALYVNERGGWTFRCSILLPSTYHMDRLLFDGFRAFVTERIGKDTVMQVVTNG